MTIKRKNKNKKTIRFLSIIALFFVIGVSLSLVYKNQKKSDTAPNLPKVAQLSLSTDKQNVAVGDEFTVTMTLDSKNTEVAAADIVVDYDTNSLEVVSVTTGNFFSNYPINQTSRELVKISGVASFDGKNLILPKGKDTVGQIKFLAIKQNNRTLIKYHKVRTIVATNGQDIYDRSQIAKLYINVQ